MSSSQGWWRRTYRNWIEIVPRGEEERHVFAPTCKCNPKVERDDDGVNMLVHNSYDGREAFERAEANLPDAYQGRLAA